MRDFKICQSWKLQQLLDLPCALLKHVTQEQESFRSSNLQFCSSNKFFYQHLFFSEICVAPLFFLCEIWDEICLIIFLLLVVVILLILLLLLLNATAKMTRGTFFKVNVNTAICFLQNNKKKYLTQENLFFVLCSWSGRC